MNVDYYLKKKHIFKKRQTTSICLAKVYNSQWHLYTTRKFRFEYVYIRVLKKLLRRKFIKATTRFFKPKYWLTLSPNYILTKKSKNSRMGAGTGSFVRLCNIIAPGCTFLRTHLYRLKTIKYLNKYLCYKLQNYFQIK